MIKSNKIEKTEEQDIRIECPCNVFSLSYKDRNSRQMALTNLSNKFDLSGQLFRK